MTEDGGDSFLGRWSRRKHAARRGASLPEPVPPAPPHTPQAAVGAASGAVSEELAAHPRSTSAEARPPELPPLDSLQGIESDYRDFLRPQVDPATRSAALRRLFSDPHFNTMDGLDVYVDDYSVAEPIPAAMLKTLSAARMLGLFADEADQAAAAAARSAEVGTEEVVASGTGTVAESGAQAGAEVVATAPWPGEAAAAAQRAAAAVPPGPDEALPGAAASREA